MVRFIGNTLYLKTLSVKPKPSVPCNQEGMLVDLCNYRNIVHPEEDRYFYHPDHLGSSSWITDRDGMPMQHLSYLPFGEEFVDQKTSNWSATYKFTGKEKDEETGYNYFGARYYWSDGGIWLSVDPLSDKYPHQTPYSYCGNRPIIIIDPDGRTEYEFNKKGYLKRTVKNDNEDIVRVVNRKGEEVSSQTYEYGTIKGITKHGSNEDKPDATVLMLKDNSSRENMFEFLANNTKVEWGTIHATEGSGQNTSIIGTSHSDEQDNICNHYLFNIKKGGGTIHEYTHSHSNLLFRFSNDPSGYGNMNEIIPKLGGDKGVAQEYWQEGVTKIRVYDARDRVYFNLTPTGYTKEKK